MLYIKHITKNGKEEFFPIRDDNVYVFCEDCEQMVYIPEPAGFIYELGAFAGSIENVEVCDACLERRCLLEDMLQEQLRQNQSNSPV